MNKGRINYCLISFALILGILVDYLFYGKPIGVSFFVFILIFTIFSLILAKKFEQKLTKIQYILLIPVILFSAMVFLRSSAFLTFFNIIGTLFLISLLFILFSNKNLYNFNFLEYFILPLSFLVKSFGKSAKFIEENIAKIEAKRKFGSPEFKSTIRGIIISIPILALLIWLLASADIVFQKYLDKLLKISIDPEIVLRILVVFVISYLFIGIFAKVFANEKSKNLLSKGNQSKFLGLIESSIVLGAIELLFLFFILIQFFYLFGGKTYVWGVGELTYSEYAKKGFGELILVSLISLLLIYGIDKFGKRENIFQKRTFKILSSILIFELFVIMASAFKRLSLYVDGYGFTFFRLFGFIFLFWLLSIFLFFLYKILSEQKETHFIFSAFWLTILFWTGINFLNPDAFIGKKNIERHLQGKQLDVWYFNLLSDDAIPEIMKIFAIDTDEEIKTDIAQSLSYRYPPLYPLMDEAEIIPFNKKLKKIKENQKWQSFNFSKNKVSMVLLENFGEIKKYQAKFWEREGERMKKELEKCEEGCEKNFSENLEEITRCKERECSWIKKSLEDAKKKAGAE